MAFNRGSRGNRSFSGGNRGGFRGGGFRRNFGPREMHKVKCSECGKDAEVPFKPTEGRPVYCKDCFMKQKGITPRKSEEDEAEEESEDSEDESEEEVEEESEE